jgi:fructose-1-phosphate kinase PfkB-like protein
MVAEVVQFIAGPAGEYVCSALDVLGITHFDVATDGETRTCTTVVATNPTAAFRETELVGVAPTVSPEQASRFVDIVHSRLAAGAAAVAVVGTHPQGGASIKSACSWPAGCGPDFYARICRVPPGQARPLVFVDSSKGIGSLLASGMRPRGCISPYAGVVDVLKINVDEFVTLEGEASAEGLPARMRAFAHRHSLTALALTDGPRPAWLLARQGASSGWEMWRFEMPAIAVANAIGAGDTTAAGFLMGLLAGLAPVDAFR